MAKIDVEDFKEELYEHIEAIKELEVSDINSTNLKLQKLFSGLNVKSIAKADVPGLNSILEKLNKTGMRRAKQLRITYIPSRLLFNAEMAGGSGTAEKSVPSRTAPGTTPVAPRFETAESSPRERGETLEGEKERERSFTRLVKEYFEYSKAGVPESRLRSYQNDDFLELFVTGIRYSRRLEDLGFSERRRVMGERYEERKARGFPSELTDSEMERISARWLNTDEDVRAGWYLIDLRDDIGLSLLRSPKLAETLNKEYLNAIRSSASPRELYLAITSRQELVNYLYAWDQGGTTKYSPRDLEAFKIPNVEAVDRSEERKAVGEALEKISKSNKQFSGEVDLQSPGGWWNWRYFDELARTFKSIDYVFWRISNPEERERYERDKTMVLPVMISVPSDIKSLRTIVDELKTGSNGATEVERWDRHHRISEGTTTYWY